MPHERVSKQPDLMADDWQLQVSLCSVCYAPFAVWRAAIDRHHAWLERRKIPRIEEILPRNSGISYIPHLGPLSVGEERKEHGDQGLR